MVSPTKSPPMHNFPPCRWCSQLKPIARSFLHCPFTRRMPSPLTEAASTPSLVTCQLFFLFLYRLSPPMAVTTQSPVTDHHLLQTLPSSPLLSSSSNTWNHLFIPLTTVDAEPCHEQERKKKNKKKISQRGMKGVDKVDTLKCYKFTLAFENSNEEDYVTEKFFQSLVAGTIPIVVGAPNIQDFAPSTGSVLHIKELGDVVPVANAMKYLASNPDAFNKSVSWKYEGPSDSFKALVDMAAVHSSCRLCIHIATKIREKEEKTAKFQNRPCKCFSSRGTIYHLYVRERGRFEMESIYLRSWNLTLNALESMVLSKFKSLNHIPIWKEERPKSIRGGDDLKIYSIYPVGINQRQALYNFKFVNDVDLRKYNESKPCLKLEVIFV